MPAQPFLCRIVVQAELGEADSTFVFVSRAEWMPEKPEEEWLWPPARAKEPLKHGGKDTAVNPDMVLSQSACDGI